jgi:single-stranded DNA-binding protein
VPFIMNAVGRLAHEPSLNVGKGMPWTEFRLLDNRMTRGEKVTEAVSFVAFGELAENFCQRAEKGQQIFAWGRQETDKFVDREGQERTKVRYVLFHFETGPARTRQEPAEAPQRRPPAPAPSAKPRAAEPPTHNDEDSGSDHGIF